MLTSKDKKYLVIIAGLLCIGSIIGYLIIQQQAFIISLAVVLLLSLALHFRTYRELDTSYQQVEALFSLFFTLKIRHPLPRMRGWAISPDFAEVITSLIKERKPGLVMELGSGVSTLVAGYCLEEIGQGRVVSLDHDKHYAACSSSALLKHRLQDTATIIYAPLKEVVIGDKTWLWYDTEHLRNFGQIDMLIVDGPPGTTQKLARYPALPLLHNLLSDDAVVLLDDTHRRDEKQTIQLWMQEFAGFSMEEMDLEKGAVILRRQPNVGVSSKGDAKCIL